MSLVSDGSDIMNIPTWAEKTGQLFRQRKVPAVCPRTSHIPLMESTSRGTALHHKWSWESPAIARRKKTEWFRGAGVEKEEIKKDRKSDKIFLLQPTDMDKHQSSSSSEDDCEITPKSIWVATELCLSEGRKLWVVIHLFGLTLS